MWSIKEFTMVTSIVPPDTLTSFQAHNLVLLSSMTTEGMEVCPEKLFWCHVSGCVHYFCACHSMQPC
eukprot:Em0054g11a